MNDRSYIKIAMFGSAALLAGAFGFQLAGYPPCEMCLWQRWPHGLAIGFGLIALIRRKCPFWPLFAALACLVNSGISTFHSGVERGWWAGLEACTTGAGLGSDLLSLDGPMVVPCDEISWQLFGLSMANYNLFASLFLAAVWLRASMVRRQMLA